MKVSMAIYEPTTESVTLVPEAQLNVHRPYRLTINGTAHSGLTDPSGAAH
jgi:hypothetical protein